MDKRGFTLVELLVGISLSTLLMLSIGYIVSGGISNLTSQKNIIENSSEFSSFKNKLQNIFINIDTNYEPILTNSGVIIKLKQNYDQGGFAYIGETIEDKLYCLSGSENTQTKLVFIKTFIPDFDIDIQKSHKIDGIGKGFFGYNKIGTNGLELTKIYLNNPTGKTSGLGLDFISDTLNNRILYKSGSKIYELLNENDGLYEPTGLYFDAGDKSLYIANSGNGEILKLSSKKYNSQPELTLTGITKNNISEFEISFYDSNGNKNIDSSNSINDFNFKNYSKQSGDSVHITDNKIKYSFSGSVNLNNEDIKLSNLSNFSQTGSYFVKLDMDNKFYKYFIQGDNNILTKDDNSLEIIEKTNKYPTIINGIGNYKYFNKNNHNIIYEKYNKKYDYILKTPVESLDIIYNANGKKILKLQLKYYSKYNCYDLEDKASRDFILIKSFK